MVEIPHSSVYLQTGPRGLRNFCIFHYYSQTNRTFLHADYESVIQKGNIPQLTPVDPGNFPKIVPPVDILFIHTILRRIDLKFLVPISIMVTNGLSDLFLKDIFLDKFGHLDK